MVQVNEQGYLCCRSHNCGKRNPNGTTAKKDTWFIWSHDNRNQGRVGLRNVIFPPEYLGKRVKFKVEVVENEVNDDVVNEDDSKTSNQV
jgi:hypothetical protein